MEDFVAYTSPRKTALIAIGSITFVVGGFWMLGAFGPPPVSSRHHPVTMFVAGWFSVIFFGAGGIAWTMRLFAAREQLRIGPAGIYSAPWSRQTVPWSEIVNVTTWTRKGQKAIVLHLQHPARFPGRGLAGTLAGPNRWLTGGDIAIFLTGTDRSFDEAMSAIAQQRSLHRSTSQSDAASEHRKSYEAR